MLLERYYSKHLYKHGDLRSLGNPKEGRVPPEIHILSTSLTTGHLCSFNKIGFWSDDGGEPNFIRAGLLPLSMAVAASSAFPPLFPPVELTREVLDASEGKLPYDREMLSDGGVFDNLGIRKFFRMADIESNQNSVMIVSDAGAGFDYQIGRRFGNIATRTARATDILMKRVSDFERESLKPHRDGIELRAVRCSIGTVIPRDADSSILDEDVQERIGRIRTDLDRFSDIELNALVRHGYETAAQAVREKAFWFEQSIPASSSIDWIPRPTKRRPTVAAVAKALEDSRSQKPGIWNPRDWASWLIVSLMIAIPALITASFALNVAFVANNATGAKVSLFYVTNRTLASDLSTGFSESLDTESTHVGSVDVSIPASHKLGNQEEPSLFRFEFQTDPTRHVALLDIKSSEEGLFIEELRDRINRANGELLVMVDGANTTFNKSVLANATFSYDLGTYAPTLDISWPTGGRLAYAQAEEFAQFSATKFPPLLEKICGDSGVKRMSFIAHDMGGRIVLNFLQRMIMAKGACTAKLGQVVLVYPDIDIREFMEVAPTLTRRAQRITIYRADNPELETAKLFHNSPRLGDARENLVLSPDVDVIDVPHGETQVFLISDIFGVLEGRPADKRFGLQSIQTSTGNRYFFSRQN